MKLFLLFPFLILITSCYLSKHYKRISLSCLDFCLFQETHELVSFPRHVPLIPIHPTTKPLTFVPYPKNLLIYDKIAEGASAQVYIVQNYLTNQLQILKRYFETQDKNQFQTQNYVIDALSQDVKWSKDPYYNQIISLHPFHDVANLSDVSLNSRNIKVIMYKLLQQVDRAHQKGIIHSDIKMQNILIDAKIFNGGMVTQKMIINLIDWNLAIPYYPGKMFRRASGTPPFKAPELTLFAEYYSPVVDVWSLGCVMYQMVTGESLVRSEFEDEVIHLIKMFGFERWMGLYQTIGVRADPFIMHQIIDGEGEEGVFKQKMANERFSEEERRFVEKMLVVQPWDRPSCKELLEDEYFNDLVMFDMSMKVKTQEREKRLEEEQRKNKEQEEKQFEEKKKEKMKEQKQQEDKEEVKQEQKEERSQNRNLGQQRIEQKQVNISVFEDQQHKRKSK